jgi:hypothetical protein
MQPNTQSSVPAQGQKQKINIYQIRNFKNFRDQNDKVYQFNIDLCEKLYKKLNNPLFVWEAIKRTLIRKKPLPVWVLKYLNSSADNLFSIKKCKGERITRKVKELFEITTPMVKEYHDINDRLIAYYFIEEKKKVKKLINIWADVRKEMKINLSDEAIKQRYYSMINLLKPIDR